MFRFGDKVTAVGGVGNSLWNDRALNLKVKGHLKINTDCRILGKAKALRDVMIGANTTIDEYVISSGKVAMTKIQSYANH